MIFNILLSAFAVQILLVQSVTALGQDCGDVFQSQLQQLLATKYLCNSAAFRDCCQIKWLVPEAPTSQYTVKGRTSQLKPTYDLFSSTVVYSTLKAYCDMDTDGGGWMVIQRRLPNGTVNFSRNWKEYENGFGDLNGEFWYGLRNIHHLTTRDEVELRIDMVRKDNGENLTWTYQTFQVAGAVDKYRLTIGGGEGPGYDAMAYHNGSQFSTYDSDNDNDRYVYSCAYRVQAGWWFNACFKANLNGPHVRPNHVGVSRRHALLQWFDGVSFASISSVTMKIRVKNCILVQGC